MSTRAGRRIVRSTILNGPAGKAFWDSWNKEKAEWQERGYSVGKYGQDWQLTQWLNLDFSVTQQSLDAARLSREEKGEGALPADWVPDDVELASPQASLLLPYQQPAALRLKRALQNGNALDASDTGTGKTFVALVVCAELGLTPCVIAPLAVLPSWERAAKYLGVKLGWLINYDKIRGGKSGLGRWKETEGKEKQFVYDYLPGQKPVLIFDECHKAKAEDTLQGKLLRAAAEHGHKTICLSATAAKDPTDMRNLGAVLGLHDGSAKQFGAFCYAYGCKMTGYGVKFDKKQRRLLEKLHREIFPLKGNRMRVADIADFPETSIHAETLTCDTAKIAAAYEEMERTIDRVYSDASMSWKDKSAEGLAAITKARRIAEEGKLALFKELAEEALEEGRSVVIFLNFRDHVAAMGEALKTDCLIWGQQTPEERQAHIDAFNADKKRVCIVSLQAGGAGLSLHDLNGNHPRQAIISPSYNAVDLKQALGRVHRAGAKTKSFQSIIFAAGTIEEEICANVREKLTNIDTMNDGHLAPPNILRHALKPAEGGTEQ